MWKRIKSLRSQCLKWNLFSVSISCHDRNLAFSVELVRFLTLCGWISLRNNHLGFYVHRSLPTSVVRALWCECCVEPLFSLIHILYTDHHSGTSAAFLQDWVLRLPWASGLPSLPATSGLQRASFTLGQWLLCSGAKVLLHRGLFFVFLSCPLCSQMLSTSVSWYLCAELLPEWTSDILLLPHSRDSESPFSMGKGMMYSLPVTFLICLFLSCGSGRGEQSITYRQLSSHLLRLIFELNSKMMVMMTTTTMMMILPYGIH